MPRNCVKSYRVVVVAVFAKTFTQGLDRAEKALYNVFAKRLNAEGTESIAREFESSVVLDGTKTMLRQAWPSIQQKKTLSARA